MNDLDKFISNLKSQHKILTDKFEKTQSNQRMARKLNLEARDELLSFRNKYKGYLKLVDEGSVSVSED